MNETTAKCIPEKILIEYLNYIKFMGFPEHKMSLINIKNTIPSASNCSESTIKNELKSVESWKKDENGNLMYDMSL